MPEAGLGALVCGLGLGAGPRGGESQIDRAVAVDLLDAFEEELGQRTRVDGAAFDPRAERQRAHPIPLAAHPHVPPAAPFSTTALLLDARDDA